MKGRQPEGGTAEVKPFTDKAVEVIFADIKNTLSRLDIVFDSYFNEHTLYEDGHIDDVVDLLREKGLVYEDDGAVWFKTTAFGQEKDRVIIKNTGEPTYRLPDIAYHREKFRRGFDWMVNVFGSDHIATVPDVLAGVAGPGLRSGQGDHGAAPVRHPDAGRQTGEDVHPQGHLYYRGRTH